MTSLPPGMIMALGALLIPLLRGRVLQAWVLLLPALSFAHLLSLPADLNVVVTLFSYDLNPVRVD